MAKIKNLLIDPVERTVEEVEREDGLKSIYALILCDCIDGIQMPNGDIIYVDDEGLMKNHKRFWAIPGFNQFIAGRGLICGIDEEGNDVDCKTLVEPARKVILWASK